MSDGRMSGCQLTRSGDEGRKSICFIHPEAIRPTHKSDGQCRNGADNAGGRVAGEIDAVLGMGIERMEWAMQFRAREIDRRRRRGSLMNSLAQSGRRLGAAKSKKWR